MKKIRVGPRYLVQANTQSTDYFEIRILDISKSREFVKISRSDGLVEWINSDSFRVIDRLEAGRRTCSVTGCKKFSRAKGMCAAHYQHNKYKV